MPWSWKKGLWHIRMRHITINCVNTCMPQIVQINEQIFKKKQKQDNVLLNPATFKQLFNFCHFNTYNLIYCTSGSSDRNYIPSEFILYRLFMLCWQHKQASAATMPRSREILNKGGESRRWKIPAGPILRLHMPSSTMTAGWLLASQPVCPLSPRPQHTNTQTDTDVDTHTCNTRFTGDKPANVILAYFSARSGLQHRLHTLPLQRRGKEVQEGWMKNGRRWRGS